jgi:hypothetical protein
MGRFMSPDDGSDQNPDDPQSWNLYSYTRNNPVNSVDEDGRQVTVCLTGTNSDGSASVTCNTISDQAYADARAAQQAQNANNPPYSGTQSPGGAEPNGIITCGGVACGTATWSPNPQMDQGAITPVYGLLSMFVPVERLAGPALGGIDI